MSSSRHTPKPVDPDELRRTIEKWLPSPVITEPTVILAGKPSAHNQDPIDLEAANENFGAKAQSVLELFLQEAPQIIEKMRQALAANDTEGLDQCAHALKGACGTIGAPAMLQTCLDIETAIRTTDLPSVAKLVEQLNTEFQQLECFWTASTAPLEF